MDGRKHPQGFAAFAFTQEHLPEQCTQTGQRRLHSTNPIKRVNKEIKRRTRVAGRFPDEASLLRLVTALLAETSDEWETGKVYLSLENQSQLTV